MADALSIEQNNKIRVALGLKPLPVPGAAATGPTFKESTREDASSASEEDDPGSTFESRSAQGFDNWKRHQDEADARRKREEKNAAIKRAREAAQRARQLEGKTLGELENADVDTKTWLMQAKKKQRKIEKERARKLAEELAERERVAEYTAEDLAGVKVGHEMGSFEGGAEQVLTLKDTTIDENEDEGDELENLELREQEKLKERLELKKKRPVYDPTEETSGILGHYDEEIEGKKRKRFTLDGQGSTAEEREAKRQDVSEKLKKHAISLDIVPETAPVSDYMDISEVKIRKPKKKKAKSTRQRVIDEDDIFPTMDSAASPATATPNTGDSMEVDSGATNGEAPEIRRRSEETSFVDDEDLQASLAIQRRAAFKKRKKVRPEDIARQLREEESQTPMDVGEDEEAPGLVIDETSEFVSNLQRPMLPERRERPSVTPAAEEPPVKRESPDEADVDMEQPYNDIEDEEDLLRRLKREESFKKEGPAPPEISGTGLEEEATLDHGLGSTLSMLKQRGLVKPTDATDLNALHRDRDRFLREKHRRETDAEKRARQQRERDRTSGKLDRMSAREREEHARWENRQRDQQDSRQMAEIFNKEYKPDVQLKYVDEFGRLMNQKEAFKQLSHQFHGKGSGRMKTEKHLKKIEEEKKREAMSTLDSSQNTGMNNAMGATARRNRQAGVRLG